MLHILCNALIIFVLVSVGLWLLWEHGVIGGKTTETGKEGNGMGMLFNLATGILFLLGVAFLGGAFLAHLQGFALQVTVLAAVGVICLAAAILLFVLNRLQRKKV